MKFASQLKFMNNFIGYVHYIALDRPTLAEIVEGHRHSTTAILFFNMLLVVEESSSPSHLQNT